MSRDRRQRSGTRPNRNLFSRTGIKIRAGRNLHKPGKLRSFKGSKYLVAASVAGTPAVSPVPFRHGRFKARRMNVFCRVAVRQWPTKRETIRCASTHPAHHFILFPPFTTTEACLVASALSDFASRKKNSLCKSIDRFVLLSPLFVHIFFFFSSSYSPANSLFNAFRNIRHRVRPNATIATHRAPWLSDRSFAALDSEKENK